jgi:hypothetical protein
MTLAHISTIITYVMWREERLCNASVLQTVHLSNVEDDCLLGCGAVQSEMSVNFYQIARRNILEDSHLHTRRCENLKTLTVRIVQTVSCRRP